MENLHAPGSRHKSQSTASSGHPGSFQTFPRLEYSLGSDSVLVVLPGSRSSRGAQLFLWAEPWLGPSCRVLPSLGMCPVNGKVRAAGARQEICHIPRASEEQRVIQMCSALRFFGADPLTSRAVGLTPAGNSPQPFPELTPAL